MAISTFLLYFAIGILPAILWLLFYLRQDVHPESNKKIIEIFLWGIIIVIPAMCLETFLGDLFPEKNVILQTPTLFFVYYIVGVGLVEEFFKYLVVKLRVIDSSHFDEPIDAMLYLIIAGLGFATFENLLVVFNTGAVGEVIMLSSIRLLTAIFLHTLAAAITGYFLALSIYHRRKIFIISGLFFTAVSHGLYDISIVKLESAQDLFSFLLPIVIIFLMAMIVYILFKKVKQLPRSCKL
jgi:RsiW-degrading membrane proteinase PrsW (M82 family)